MKRESTTDNHITVLIADDQMNVRRGLEIVLGLEPDLRVVGTAANGLEAVEIATLLNPDIIVMDLSMPYLDGIEATRRIRDKNLSAHVILLVTQTDCDIKRQAEMAGVASVIEKAVPDIKLAEEIRSTMLRPSQS